MAGLGLGPQTDDELALMLDESARGFLSARHSTKRVRQLRGDITGLDRAVWREMAELGWLSLCVPEDRGGAGLGPEYAVLLARGFGAALLNEPLSQWGYCPPLF